jgi:hypothetical protein
VGLPEDPAAAIVEGFPWACRLRAYNERAQSSTTEGPPEAGSAGRYHCCYCLSLWDAYLEDDDPYDDRSEGAPFPPSMG